MRKWRKGLFLILQFSLCSFFCHVIFYYLLFTKFHFLYFLPQIWLPWSYRFVEGNMSAENPETRLMGSWWIRCRPQGGTSDLARTQRSGGDSREGGEGGVMCWMEGGSSWEGVAPSRPRHRPLHLLAPPRRLKKPACRWPGRTLSRGAGRLERFKHKLSIDIPHTGSLVDKAKVQDNKIWCGIPTISEAKILDMILLP